MKCFFLLRSQLKLYLSAWNYVFQMTQNTKDSLAISHSLSQPIFNFSNFVHFCTGNFKEVFCNIIIQLSFKALGPSRKVWNNWWVGKERENHILLPYGLTTNLLIHIVNLLLIISVALAITSGLLYLSCELWR